MSAGLLLDTHTWFWFLVRSERLHRAAREAIEAMPGRVWLSPISVWELGLLAERGRVEIEGDFRSWVERANRHFPINEAPLTGEIALQTLEADLPHRDPADHILAATTMAYGLTLVTADQRLLAAEWLPTLAAA
ncbi:MAG: type II toxin-antitoxin system VapC family toxin [Thermoanaerobaculia bacterium]|nr:type II toxin-antitoxin system VapC family toxin [Thermoanaerobaculia bacterium]